MAGFKDIFVNNQQPIFLRRNTVAIAALTSAIVLSGMSPAHAQAQPTQAEIDDLQAQIAALQARLNRIEAQQQIVPANAKAAPATAGGASGLAPAGSPATGIVTSKSSAPVQVSALLQEQYNGYTSENGTPSQRGFRLRRGEIHVDAPKITDKISASVMFDVAKDPFGTPSFTPLGAATAATDKLNNTNAVLQDFILTYKLNATPVASNQIDLGQFKIPLGYESDQISSSALDLTERAQIFRERDVAGGGFGDIRDQGIRLKGAFSQGDVSYDLAAMQGLGELQNQTAQADPKAFVGRIILSPGNHDLKFGVSGATGDNTAPLSGVVANSATADPAVGLDRTYENAFAYYKKNKFTLQGEYTSGHSSAETATAQFLNAKGYYAGFGYTLSKKWQLVGRYDTLEAKSGSVGKATVDGTSIETTAGLNYFLHGNNSKIQTDLVKVEGEPGALTTSNSLQLRTEYQVSF